MLFWLPTTLLNIVTDLGLYKVAERMHMNAVRGALVFLRVTETDWFSSGGYDDIVSYDFATGTVQDYHAENIVPVRRQRVYDGLVAPVREAANDMNCFSGVTRKMISEAERDYQQYRGVIADDADQSVFASAGMMDDLEDVFALETFWERDAEPSFTVLDR